MVLVVVTVVVMTVVMVGEAWWRITLMICIEMYFSIPRHTDAYLPQV